METNLPQQTRPHGKMPKVPKMRSDRAKRVLVRGAPCIRLEDMGERRDLPQEVRAKTPTETNFVHLKH